MRFLKENSYDIVKLFVNQIGIAIFSFFLYTAVGMIEDASLKLKITVVLSVFAIAFYFVLLYTVAWEWGAKDKIRIDAGKTSQNSFKGALLAIVANIPNFVLAIASLALLGINMSGGSEWFYTAFGIVNMLLRFIACMYVGVLQGIFSAFSEAVKLNLLLDAIGFLVLPLLAVLATHTGYIFGLKEKRIFPVAKKKSTDK